MLIRSTTKPFLQENLLKKNQNGNFKFLSRNSFHNGWNQKLNFSQKKESEDYEVLFNKFGELKNALKIYTNIENSFTPPVLDFCTFSLNNGNVKKEFKIHKKILMQFKVFREAPVENVVFNCKEETLKTYIGWIYNGFNNFEENRTFPELDEYNSLLKSFPNHFPIANFYYKFRECLQSYDRLHSMTNGQKEELLLCYYEIYDNLPTIRDFIDAKLFKDEDYEKIISCFHDNPSFCSFIYLIMEKYQKPILEKEEEKILSNFYKNIAWKTTSKECLAHVHTMNIIKAKKPNTTPICILENLL